MAAIVSVFYEEMPVLIETAAMSISVDNKLFTDHERQVFVRKGSRLCYGRPRYRLDRHRAARVWFLGSGVQVRSARYVETAR